MALIEDLKKIIKEKKYSNSFVAKALNISPATLHLWLNNKYTGHVDKINEAVAKFIEIEHLREEYFDKKDPVGKFGWFFKMAGCIPVNRQIKDNDATSAAMEVLENGKALGLFPEGTRNKTDQIILPSKLGAVSIDKK